MQLLGVTMTGLLAGNELGTLIGLHPALRTLPLATQIQAEQALTTRLGRLMPFSMGATVLATTTAAVDQRGEPGFPLAATAAAASALMLGVTLVGNVPLNAQTLAYLTDGDAAGWARIRRRWERLHVVRVLLDLVALAASAGAVASTGRVSP